MPYVAMVFHPLPDWPAGCPSRAETNAAMTARYLAGLYDLGEWGLQRRRQAAPVGMEGAEQWIGLSDGGNGLEHFLTTTFPRDRVLILDFWPASAYLADLAQALHPDDEDERAPLLASWCHTMKEQGGTGIVAVREALSWPPRKPSVKAPYETTRNYLRNNVHRRDYPTYVKNGWCIGSGSVESACKTGVNQRLKRAGLRWGQDGTDEMCPLRALFRSEPSQGTLFWSRCTQG